MRAEEIKGLMEAYSRVNETPEEYLEEILKDVDYSNPQVIAQIRQRNKNINDRGGLRGQLSRQFTTMFGTQKEIDKISADDRADRAREQIALNRAKNPNWKPKPVKKPEPAGAQEPAPTTKPTGSGDTGASTLAAKPTVPSTVLAKKGGVEGKLDKSTGKFTAGNFSDAEKARYAKFSPKPSTPSQTSADKPTTSAKDQWAKSNSTLAKNVTPVGTQKGTGQSEMSKQAAELRDMQKASQMRQKGADVMGSNITSVRQDVEKFNKPENLNKKAPAGTALAAQQQKQEMQKLKTSPSADLKMSLDIFDVVKGYLLDEGYAETEQAAMVIMVNMSEEWRSEILDELYKGKHGQSEKEYMAGRSDAGKRISGDEKEGPASYASRWHKGSEPTKPGEKPKNVQKLAKWEKDHLEIRKKELKKKEEEKKVAKEGHAVTIEDIVKLLDENREHDREMRKAAARERAEEKRDRKEEGKRSAKAPGRLGKSAGTSYADKEQLSIKGHDEVTKKSRHTVGNPFPEHVEYVDEAQEARENPEKHEENEKKEHEKKYGHVRGEKTPMPPRGDKRREEFEKWYAKQMGR